ncbi:MAG: septation protein SpoVG [Acidobacteria bacterium]|nr:MAG: septation protein SpoVG [Acidobacteriota bacterium]
MEVTEVRISPAKGGKVRAFVSIIIDDCFIVNDLRVLEGREGQLFVTMPARKTRNGQMRDTAHPLNSETRKLIEDRVLEEYLESVANRTVPKEKSGSPKASTLDRIAARLFVEEFWVPEESRGRDFDA